MIQFFLDAYYIIIMAWSIYYMFMSFSSVLPYSHCNNAWNTPCCYATGEIGMNDDVNVTTTAAVPTLMTYAPGEGNGSELIESCPNGTALTSSTVEFWE